MIDVITESKNSHPHKPMTELLTVEELAAFLKVPKSWIYGQTRMSKINGFPMIRVGKYCRFDPDAVLDWLNKREEKKILRN